VVGHALEIREEKQLVAAQRSADRRAFLMPVA